MMPKRVLVIGMLFCVGGILAIWDVVASLLNGDINLNFGVLLLPVGIGLLRGRPSSQWWARFWIILGYIGCGLLVAAVIVWPEAAYATWFDSQLRGPAAVPYVVGMAMLSAVLLVVMHKLLYSEKANEFFRSGGDQAGGLDAPAEEAPEEREG
jgi:hypothetical protein